MTEKLDYKEMVKIDELLMAQMIQIDTVSKLLIDKEIITDDEFFTKLKQVQAEYQRKRKSCKFNICVCNYTSSNLLRVYLIGSVRFP